MWNKFTDRARQAVYYAQQEAAKQGVAEVSTEHILLGLTVESDHPAASMLGTLGVSNEKIREAVQSRLKVHATALARPTRLSREARFAIDFALVESRGAGQRHIGTNHLLMGLLHEGAGVAANVLTECGVNVARARAAYPAS
jgi:ATP-dependent Clp protease ATP-binding subunit ClpC